jgi:hypothetical protein
MCNKQQNGTSYLPCVVLDSTRFSSRRTHKLGFARTLAGTLQGQWHKALQHVAAWSLGAYLQAQHTQHEVGHDAAVLALHGLSLEQRIHFRVGGNAQLLLTRTHLVNVHCDSKAQQREDTAQSNEQHVNG